MELGNKLRELRKKQGLSQKELALLAGVAQSVVSNAENNAREPTLDSLVKICGVFSLGLSDFFALLEKQESPPRQRSAVVDADKGCQMTEDEDLLLCRYRQLSLRDQTTIKHLVEVLLKQEKKYPSSTLINGNENALNSNLA